MGQIVNLLENRKNKFPDIAALIQPRIKFLVESPQMKLVPDPHAELFVDDRIVQKINIVVHIITQFLDGIDVGADIYNVIWNFCPLDLTKNISAHFDASP